MSSRLERGGILINRKEPLEFSFDSKRFVGFSGDSLASALLANNQTLVGRSFKYHRPRGILTSGPEEPNALVGIGERNSFEPNQRATTVELYQGLRAISQNRWPNLNFDIGALSSLAAAILPAGFYYKTFIHPRAAWKHLFEPLIRRSAGLGKPPRYNDLDSYEHFYCHVDVLVVGGGLSGLIAAHQVGLSGAETLLVEQSPFFGGKALTSNEEIENFPADSWVHEKCTILRHMENVSLRTRITAAGVFDHGYVLLYERVADHAPGDGRPRHRLWKVRAKKIILASGAIERPLVFSENDVPRVMLASAVRDYAKLYGVSPGDRTVIVTNNDDAYKTAILLNSMGLSIPAIIDLRSSVESELIQRVLDLKIPIKFNKAVSGVNGKTAVKDIKVCAQSGEGTVEETIGCDCIAMSGGWSPVLHLWSHCGGKLLWDEELGMFLPNLNAPPLNEQGENFIFPVGSALGKINTVDCGQSAIEVSLKITKALGLTVKKIDLITGNDPLETGIKPVWLIPNGAGNKLKSKSFIDFQNDVKASDIDLSVREGYDSVEHLKRYTTLGMATDQGKLSNVNGLALLSNLLARPIQAVGTTTFRPPYTPISMGSIAGEAKGLLFKPTRKTTMDEWSCENGAYWEPVADWRRPYAYLRANETISQAVNREIINTRKNVGILDASTLGKILVKGPDAGKFLDLIYTNMISTIKIGRCRYGLMCNENGFLFDDGVVARVSEDTFICHTTTGGSDRVHAWMEEWLQTEWWNLNVFTVNATEQYSQIAIVGPYSKSLLEELVGNKKVLQELPFMGCVSVNYNNFEINIFRISFSGELSYEVAVPAGNGIEFWNRCMELGGKYGIQPYGTEALHVMRAEKGFIMIGDETDGTVIPQDLNLDWAVSKNKRDFLGKRAHSRSHMIDPNRKVLVGLLTNDPQIVLPDGAHAVENFENCAEQEIIGHVTSSYYSPTLNRSIALALIARGTDLMGQTLDFPVSNEVVVKAKVVDPVFYDPDRKKQDG